MRFVVFFLSPRNKNLQWRQNANVSKVALHLLCLGSRSLFSHVLPWFPPPHHTVRSYLIIPKNSHFTFFPGHGGIKPPEHHSWILTKRMWTFTKSTSLLQGRDGQPFGDHHHHGLFHALTSLISCWNLSSAAQEPHLIQERVQTRIRARTLVRFFSTVGTANHGN